MDFSFPQFRGAFSNWRITNKIGSRAALIVLST